VRDRPHLLDGHEHLCLLGDYEARQHHRRPNRTFSRRRSRAPVRQQLRARGVAGMACMLLYGTGYSD
jgi:hypothetical protein